MHVYLNGEFLQDTAARISVFDGGFLYGDGVYTTLRVYQGRAVDLQAHWERLTSHAAALAIPLQLDLKEIARITGHLVDLNHLKNRDGRLRITISRGGTAANSLPLENLDRITPTVLATMTAVSPRIETWQKAGIKAVILGPAYARSHFPELKTLNGLTTVLALRQAARTGCQEAILTGRAGKILEGAISNIFMVNQGQLLTPAPRGGFLPGRTRARILDIAQRLEIPTVQTGLTTADLTAASEVFCASSVREILPIISIDQHPVASGLPGNFTRRIQAAYHQAMK